MNRLAIAQLTCVMLCLFGLGTARADVMDAASTRSFSLGVGSMFDVRIVKFSSQILFGKKDPNEDESSIDVYPDMAPLTDLIKSLSIRQ